jgi:O-antigen/teichoic acid export membrane protein
MPSQPSDPVPSDVAQLAVGAGINLAGRGIGQATQFLILVLLARLLDPAAFGLYAIGLTLLRMGSVVVPLGLDSGVVYYGSQVRLTDASRLRGVLEQSLGLALLSGLVAGAVLYGAAPWVSDHLFGKPGLAPVLRWFAPAFALAAGLKVAAAATRVSQRMQYAVYTEDLGQPVLNLLLVLAAAGLSRGVGGAVAAVAVSYGLALLLALRFQRALFPQACAPGVRAPSVARDLLAFSLPTVLAGMAHTYIVWIDRLIIGSCRPVGEVGVYQAVSQASILFAVILGAFNSMLAPLISELHHRGERERLAMLYRVSTKWGLYLSLPFFLVLCAVPDDLLSLVFGGRYAGGALALVVLSVSHLVHAGTGAAALLLILTGHPKRWLALSAVAFALDLGLNLWLTPRYGMAGAATATTCAIGGLFLCALAQTRRVLGLWPYDRRYLKGIAAAAAAAATLLALPAAGIASPLARVAAAGLVSFGVFGGGLLLLGLDAEDREFIRRVRARLGGRPPSADSSLDRTETGR